jgi:hypothetical protein
MYLPLHKLRIHLQSDDAPLNRAWQQLFTGWLEVEADTAPADASLHLSLVETLQATSLPARPPYFSDSHTLPDNVGILSVYQAGDEQALLHYLDGALVTVPLGPYVEGSTPVASGVITPTALAYGRFEDVTFTSLAPLLRRRGYYLIHAFAASRDGQAILIVGPSGSGKTTTGLSLILAGWRLLANDVLLLEKRPDGVYALPTPGGTSVKRPTFALLPDLQAMAGNVSLSQARVDITTQQLVNGQWSEPAPVVAIYFPHIEDRAQSALQAQGRALCLARLLEESVDRWDKATMPAHINLLHSLSRQAAAYTLRLGRDVATLPALLDQWGAVSGVAGSSLIPGP